MKKFLKNISLFCTFLISISLNLYSQNADSPIELEQGTNKLFVVIGVILIIFSGIVLYLFSLDKKVKKLKKELKQ